MFPSLRTLVLRPLFSTSGSLHVPTAVSACSSYSTSIAALVQHDAERAPIPIDNDMEFLQRFSTPISHRRLTKRLQAALSSIMVNDASARHSLVERYGFTVLKVQVVPDGRQAHVLWDCHPGQEAACRREIDKQVARIRTTLANGFRAKFLPFLQFHHNTLQPDKQELASVLDLVAAQVEAEKDLPQDPRVDLMIESIMDRMARRRAHYDAGAAGEHAAAAEAGEAVHGPDAAEGLGELGAALVAGAEQWSDDDEKWEDEDEVLGELEEVDGGVAEGGSDGASSIDNGGLREGGTDADHGR